MRCPYCGSLDTQVKDSRPTDDASAIRRRRICPDCGGRFTTFERVQLRELFGPEALGPAGAVRSRQAPAIGRGRAAQARGRAGARRADDQRHRAPAREHGRGEVPSETVGELVMEGLKGLDDVAYVRFASVYKNFREAKDFEEILVRPGERGPGR